MSLGLMALNAAIDARLRPLLPAGMGLGVGYAPENLTDLAAPIHAHVVPDGAAPVDATGPQARLMAGFTVYVFLDQERIDAQQESDAYAFFDAALSHIIGWPPLDLGACRLIASPTPLAYDGRIGRLEFSFQVPVYVRRTA